MFARLNVINGSWAGVLSRERVGYNPSFPGETSGADPLRAPVPGGDLLPDAEDASADHREGFLTNYRIPIRNVWLHRRERVCLMEYRPDQ